MRSTVFWMTILVILAATLSGCAGATVAAQTPATATSPALVSETLVFSLQGQGVVTLTFKGDSTITAKVTYKAGKSISDVKDGYMVGTHTLTFADGSSKTEQWDTQVFVTQAGVLIRFGNNEYRCSRNFTACRLDNVLATPVKRPTSAPTKTTTATTTP